MKGRDELTMTDAPPAVGSGIRHGITVEGLECEYRTRRGMFRAVDGVSFQAEEATFFTLLGPSGCGKTTTLRAIAGFQEPVAGKVTIKDQVVVDKSARPP